MDEIIITNPQEDQPEYIFTESVLNGFEQIAKKIIKIKKDTEMDFDFIENLLYCFCLNNKFYIYKNTTKTFKKWEIIAIALNYYKSIDSELYEYVKDIVFAQKPNMRLNIYNMSEVENFDEKDFEFEGVEKYAKSPHCLLHDNKDIIYIPLEIETDRVIYEKDKGRVYNLYAMVHELAHSFDCIIDEIVDENSVDINYDCEIEYLFNESIARAFELNLIPYLLENKLIESKNDVLPVHYFLHNDTLYKAYILCISLKLAKVFQEKEKITVKDADNIFNSLGFVQPSGKRGYVEDVLKTNNPKYKKTFFRDMGYAISGMVSPTIIEFLNNGKIDELKEFFKLSKKGFFYKTLETLEIPVNDEGIKKLEKNMLKYQENIKQEEVQER